MKTIISSIIPLSLLYMGDINIFGAIILFWIMYGCLCWMFICAKQIELQNKTWDL